MRQALGDGSDGQKYIETVPRRGYSFTAAVQEAEAGESSSPAQAAPANSEPQKTTTSPNGRRKLWFWPLALTVALVITAALASQHFWRARNISPQKVMLAVPKEQWAETAIFVTVDEGGGYYDSGFIQPVDFFGTGPRIPMIAVSPFSTGGHISHVYNEHSSFVKFVERNWMLNTTLSDRSRDNLPNPKHGDDHIYVPRNMPAIGDLFDLFNFDRDRDGDHDGDDRR